MFDCKDINGKQIHTDDVIVVADNTPNGIPVGEDAVVMTILSPDEVSINPMSGGLPEIVEPRFVDVKYSLLGELEGCASNEKLQEILQAAEENFRNQKASTKAKKKSSSGGSTKPAKAEVQVEW